MIRRVFSFPVAVSCLLAVLGCTTVRGRFDDPDMWWHLKLGQVMWTTHHIPTSDLFSYTTGHHAYLAHEWLAQLAIYGAYWLGGYPGLMAWLCCLTAAMLIAGYALCSLYSGNAKVAFVGALAVWMFGTVGYAVRPQMIGYLLLIVELVLLHLGRSRDARWFFALPPLFAVWVNCHGSFVLGMAVAAILLFSSWFEFQHGLLVAAPWNPRTRRMLMLALGISVAALFVNPFGGRLVVYPFHILLHSPVNLSQVDEWRPLQLSSGRGIGFLGVLGCIVLAVIVRRAELFWDELLLLTLGIWSGASHERLLFAFGILAAPVLSRLLAPAWDSYEAAKDRPAPNAVLMAAALVVAVLSFPSRQNLKAQVERASPVKAVEFIRGHGLAGPMLNDYAFGGYLIWAASEYPVFVDGRTDIFEWTGVLEEYGQWAQLLAPPNALLDRYGVRFCLLNRQSPMRNILPLLDGWKEIYADENSVVLVLSTPSGSASAVSVDAPSAAMPGRE